MTCHFESMISFAFGPLSLDLCLIFQLNSLQTCEFCQCSFLPHKNLVTLCDVFFRSSLFCMAFPTPFFIFSFPLLEGKTAFNHAWSFVFCPSVVSRRGDPLCRAGQRSQPLCCLELSRQGQQGLPSPAGPLLPRDPSRHSSDNEEGIKTEGMMRKSLQPVEGMRYQRGSVCCLTHLWVVPQLLISVPALSMPRAEHRAAHPPPLLCWNPPGQLWAQLSVSHFG